MKPYKRNTTLTINENFDFKRSLKEYFQYYNFEFKEEEKNQFTFYKKHSLLNGWKFNPLNWESKIYIKTTNNKLEINYTNEGNGQITPFAFVSLFSSFFNNLKLFLTNSIDYKEKNNIAIKKARRKIFLSFLMILASVACFAILGDFVSKNFNVRFLRVLSIIIGSLFSLKMINHYWISKALEK
ncbi:MAG: hypothetical protein P8H13_00195 [Polaribacter sp.]|nr:hypothetical protein [Polaribacter sp.]MDG1810342.1 hypothetical protein [Polaribacter sp.]